MRNHAHRSGRRSASRFSALPGDIDVSFEFFPPKTESAARRLNKTVQDLSAFSPKFLSVTYGAGGTTRERTLGVLRDLGKETRHPLAGHLTCVGMSKADVDKAAEAYWETGIRHIVALRGDGDDEGRFVPHPEGYTSAADLVGGLKRLHPFEISVAAYPDVHPDAASPQADLDNLKRKLDAGACRAITQFFFSAEAFLRFRDKAQAAGITAPIVPGILPVTNFAQTCKFAEMCGTKMPDWVREIYSGVDGYPGAQPLVAATLSAEMCHQLYSEGVRDFHFYTLNRAELTLAICHLLGLRLPAPLEEAA